MAERRALLLQGAVPIRALIRRQLIQQNFQPTDAADGNRAWEHLKAHAFDLIVLDMGTPGMEVTTLCRTIRRLGPNQRSAIVVLTESGGEAERVLALQSGADDCLTLPFSAAEFQARISALMRRLCRPHALGPHDVLTAAALQVDPERRIAFVGEKALPLTRREFNLLYVLMSAPGVVFSRDALVARLAGTHRPSNTRLIDPIVCRVRKQLKKLGLSSRLIRTVHGSGYTFARRLASR